MRTDVDTQLRRRAIHRIVVTSLAGVGLVVGGIVVILSDGGGRYGGVLAGAGAISLGVAAATAAKHLLPPPDAVEDRHAPGSPACIDCGHEIAPGRRRLLIGGAVSTAAAVTAGLVVRDTGAERALRNTSWRRGDALVTLDGEPIVAEDLEVGDLVTAWPRHSVEIADTQVVLMRLDPERLASEARVPEEAPEGFVAYSKLCTHMGCPVGLFQQDPDVLVCPCHQAVFDVFDSARPVQGPARRPLPQLPLLLGDDGTIQAAGGFTGAVGPGWWGRPR